MPTYACDGCDATCDPDKDKYCLGDFNTVLCENCREAAWDRQQERLMEDPGPTMQEQLIDAWKIKHGLPR